LNGLTLQNLETLYRKEVAGPLHLQHAYYSWDPYIGRHKVTGYKEGKVFNKYWPAASPYEDSTVFGAASTLHTTAEDYARFLIAIMENKGLKKETVNEMLKQQSHLPKELLPFWGGIEGWSLGFAVEPTSHSTRYSHGGDNGGFQAGCMFYKERKNGYVFFTNCDGSWPFYQKLRAFLGEVNRQ
jgi:CubicO group peptidase (beta-lactamase class C family)